ncbi:MAG: hypothetical protein HYT94_02570 [Parcubacteria group bacterium]|nr:hypothetical protein [Parcubacteria group bacterium]
MNILFSGAKNFFRYVRFSIRLIKDNLVLFGRLVLLAAASLACGIIFDHLLSYFDEGARPVSWYVLNIALLFGLFVSAAFVWYLAMDILGKQAKTEIQRGKAEHTLANREDDEKELLRFLHTPPGKTLLENTKAKLLQYLPGKKKDE